MTTMFERVSAMNIAFGNPKGDPQSIDWGRLQKQCQNIYDEYKELQTAIVEGDLSGHAGARDALCDIMVFALGAYHFMGVDAQVDSVDPSYAGEKGDPSQPDWGVLRALCGGIPDYHAALMAAIEGEDFGGAGYALRSIMGTTLGAYHFLGLDAEEDMRVVVKGVRTRFCHNEADLQATLAKYARLGVECYVEGEFPTKCLKSARDQKDSHGENYPKGKFLKSVSYRTAEFQPVGAGA